MGSIFIFQNAQNAICPSSPFYVYLSMHNDKNAIIYEKDKNEIVIEEDGMSYLWIWLHTMFGPKDVMFGDKQVSNIYHNGNVNAICPIPPVQRKRRKKKKEEKKVKIYGAYHRIIMFEYLMILVILLLILMIIVKN